MRFIKEKFEVLLEYIYIKYRIVLCIIISSIVTFLYAFNIITNIRASISNLIDLTAALMVIITLILTLLLYLNDKEKYNERFKKYKVEKKQLYYLMYKISIANVLSTGILILINILEIKAAILKYIIAFIGSFIFFYMLLGVIYMLWFAIYIVIGLDSIKDKMS